MLDGLPTQPLWLEVHAGSLLQSLPMPLSIEKQVIVKMDGKAWSVKENNLITINESEFIKLPGSEYGLLSLVCHGIIIGGVKSLSLSQSPGLKKLMMIRNEQQREDLASESGASQACALFGKAGVGAKPAAKRHRRSMAEIRELRDAPVLLNVTLPEVLGHPAKIIQMVRPVHPCDDLCVPLDSDIIEHIVLFIREQGLSRDLLSKKRLYKAAGHDAPAGIWRSKTGFVVNLKQRQDDEANGQKFKRVKTLEDAINALAGTSDDQPVPIGDISDGQEEHDDEHSDGDCSSSGHEPQSAEASPTR